MQVPDSAGTSTAFLSGAKANFHTVAVTGRVGKGDCAASLKPENRVDSIVKWAQDAGKETGFVTTTQVTHGTPAGLYAKSPDRKWQCDTAVKKAGPSAVACKDVARQLVEDEPAKNMKVIMGGGRQEMGADTTSSRAHTKQMCVRGDGRNLAKEWREEKRSRGRSHAYVTTTGELRQVEVEKTEFLMGLFADLHMPFEVDRNTSLDGTPDLREMTSAAVRRLRRSEKGFFLLVESGRIDHGLHYSQPRRALEEILAMEEALKETLDLVDLNDTLVLVTADHSHVMTINGYPRRGNDILGPMSHLFHRVHEQPHVAHVMAYSACIGPYKNCDRLVESPRNRYQTKSHSTYPNTSGGASSVLLSSICLPSVVVMYCLGFMWRCC